jgi:hypothetical protein
MDVDKSPFGLSKEEMSSVFKLCTDYKIDTSDPILGVLIELKHQKRDIITLLSKAQNLTVKDELSDTLNIQKEVASAINAQLLTIKKIYRTIIFAFVGVGLLLGSSIGYFVGHASSLDGVIADLGVEIIAHPNGTGLTLKHGAIQDVTRLPSEVKIRFKR